MATTQVTYYCADAAERVAELIEFAQEAGRQASRKRDQHRADTTVRALKEALGLILLERECKDGERHPLPNVEQYLKRHSKPPVI